MLTWKGELEMQLSAPKQITWWIAVVIGVLGILATLVTIPVLSGFAFWLVVIGFVLLALATLLEGL
jgi:heme/copper-type cytochrome/quinol oxidase subunit 1